MSDWGDKTDKWNGKERRIVDTEQTTILANMDKNLAVLANEMTHFTSAFKDHKIEDAKFQDSQTKSTDDLKLIVARWGGGIAVLIVVAGLVLKAWK